MKKYFFLVPLILSSFLIEAQDTIPDFYLFGKKWKKSTMGFSASIGRDKYYNDQYTYDNLKYDTKNSQYFYNFNPNDFNQYNNYNKRSFIYQFNFSFHPYSNKRSSFNQHHEVRIGFLYYKGIDNYLYFSNKYHRELYGTAAPDTSYTAFLTYEQVIDQIGTELSYLIRSKPFLKRVTLYGGIGAGISYTVFSQVKETIDTYSLKNIGISSPSGTYYYDIGSDSYQYNYFKHNNGIFLRTFIPYGFDVKFHHDLHFFFEGRSGFSYQRFWKGRGRIRSQHYIGIGLRFNF